MKLGGLGNGGRDDHVASGVPMDMIRTLKHLLAAAFGLIRESVEFLLLSFRPMRR